MNPPEHVVYEHPLNERMRLLLRIEFVLRNLHDSLGGDQVWHHRATVTHLLDLADLLTRSDLRAEVVRELERLAGILTTMQSAPEVDRQRLQDVLDQLDGEVDRLHRLPLPFAQQLMESDMIGQLRKRHNLALGNCDFDQPAYRWWLARPSAARQRDLDAWSGPFVGLGSATALILGLIRQAAAAAPESAQKGFYQRSLDTAQAHQLLRIVLPLGSEYYPEVSAGRHRFSIRFVRYTDAGKPQPADEDVPFRLACCSL
ncbi:MAG: cell division protein ZapD [Pseudomonadota bacterium]